MRADEMDQYLRATYTGLRILENQDDLFYLYDPDRSLPPERQLPFATIVTGDHYDVVSQLAEPGAWRFNLGLTRATYTAMFGKPPTQRDESGLLIADYDYAARNQLVPHPYYASQYWVGIVEPHDREPLKPLIDEAYGFAVRKYTSAGQRRPPH